MDINTVVQLLLLLLLLALSAFFSSAETALVTVNKIHIEALADEGMKRAKNLLKIINNSGKMLSTILIGNNLVNIYASSLTTTLVTKQFGNAYVGAATGILTLIVLIFGEITPKTMATVHAEKIALAYACIIAFLMKLLTPVIFLINKLSNGVMFLFQIDPSKKGSTVTEHELRTLVDVGHEEGVIEKEEREMIYNVFDFGDSLAKDIMVPRIDISFVNVDATYHELMEIFREDGYTRFPVYEDTTDTVIGIINMKDLLLNEQLDNFSIRSILREPYFTYEYKHTSSLMLEMREKSINFAIVLDEYGATAGLITLEDLLEEIVGEIRDEYDEEEEELLTTIVPDHEYTAVGSMKLDDLNEALHIALESEDYDSLGGYVIELLDHLPVKGEEAITADGIRLVVDKIEKNRIERVHLYLPEIEDTPEDN